MLSEFSGSPPSIRITEPATPIPVTGWTPFLGHGFLGPFDSGPSKAFRMASPGVLREDSHPKVVATPKQAAWSHRFQPVQAHSDKTALRLTPDFPLEWTLANIQMA